MATALFDVAGAKEFLRSKAINPAAAGSVDGMNDQYAVALASAMQAAESATGDTSLKLLQGERDPKQEAQYYANWKGVPYTYAGVTYQPADPGKSSGHKATTPDRSAHSYGLGADISGGPNPAVTVQGPAIKYMTEHRADFGLANGSADLGLDDPAHFQVPQGVLNKVRVAGGAEIPAANNLDLSAWVSTPAPSPAIAAIEQATAQQAPAPMPGRPASIDAAPVAVAPTPMPVPSFRRGFDPLPAPSPLVPGPPTVAPAFQPGMMGRGLPSPAAPVDITVNGGAPEAPPMPMPSRGVPSGFVRLSSTGEYIAPGDYPAGDHKHMVHVEDDGTGNAKITKSLNPGEIRGVLDPFYEGEDTIAGKIIKPIIDAAKQQAGDQVNAAADKIKQVFGQSSDGTPVNSSGSPDERDARNAAAITPGNLANAFVSGIANFHPFGIGAPNAAPVTVAPTQAQTRAISDVPANSVQQPVAQPQKNTSGSPDDRDLVSVLKDRAAAKTQPAVDPLDLIPPTALESRADTLATLNANMTGRGLPATASAPVKQTIAAPTTTYKTVDMVVSNPDYVKYIQAQKSDPIGAGPGSFADLQAMVAKPVVAPPPAPPKTITVKQRVPVTVAPPRVVAPVPQPVPVPVPPPPPVPRLTPQEVANVAYGSGASAQGWDGKF